MRATPLRTPPWMDPAVIQHLSYHKSKHQICDINIVEDLTSGKSEGPGKF